MEFFTELLKKINELVWGLPLNFISNFRLSA